MCLSVCSVKPVRHLEGTLAELQIAAILFKEVGLFYRTDGYGDRWMKPEDLTVLS